MLLNRVGHSLAHTFHQDLYASGTIIVRVSARDEQRAREIIARYTDKDFSYTDAMSFAVMERLHITRAFTFDHHFAQYGFVPLA